MGMGRVEGAEGNSKSVFLLQVGGRYSAGRGQGDVGGLGTSAGRGAGVVRGLGTIVQVGGQGAVRGLGTM